MTKEDALVQSRVPTKTPATEEIAQNLAALIRDGAMAAGTNLPTEQRLSVRFGVGSTVVRETISHLKVDGLVESRQGSCVSVNPASLRKSFKL